MTIASITNMEQPGRLFNRAPSVNVNIDPFFSDHHQNRRPMQQVSSYHDLDDISTMAALPEAKACGGVAAKANVSRASPQTVTDVKTFDPACFQDDAGGVAIDLCLPETDDGEDYFLLMQQEEDEELQEFLREQQPPCPQHFRPSRSFLAPIAEERRVTFAAQHVVLKVDQTDSCAIDQRYVHQVLDAVQVWFIPHHTQYTERQRSNMWYTKAELASMRDRAIKAKQSSSRKQRRISLEQQAQQRLQELDSCSFLTSPFDVIQDPKLQKSLGSEQRSGSERRARYEAMVDAVLLEQYEQRRMCLRVYGRVEPGFCGILDPERLAKVYSIAGTTDKSLERAMEKAQTILEEMDEEEEEEQSSAAAAARVSGSKKTKANNNNKLKRTTSFNASAIEVETSLCLDRGVGSIFQALVSPFLEIRKGDLFLAIGEEMSIPL